MVLCVLTGEHPAELWQAVPNSVGPLHRGGPLDCGLSQCGADQPASGPCHPAPDPVMMPAEIILIIPPVIQKKTYLFAPANLRQTLPAVMPQKTVTISTPFPCTRFSHGSGIRNRSSIWCHRKPSSCLLQLCTSHHHDATVIHTIIPVTFLMHQKSLVPLKATQQSKNGSGPIVQGSSQVAG